MWYAINMVHTFDRRYVIRRLIILYIMHSSFSPLIIISSLVIPSMMSKYHGYLYQTEEKRTENWNQPDLMHFLCASRFR